jgi:cation:H+ antiporter
VLAIASEQFVLGAARLARTLRISAVVIGAIVVGFGTSLPELLVSVVAAAGGTPDIALGNVVGSNIANMTLVLGAAALIAPIVVTSSVIKREAPIALAAMLALGIVLVLDSPLLGGVLLLGGLVVAMALILLAGRDEPEDPLGPEAIEAVDGRVRSTGGETLRAVLGLAGTLAGAQLVVVGAEGIADRAGLSEGFVGLTIVALGTSLPELFTAIQAARKGESDLIVGNVLGSTVFNSLGIAGVAIVIAPGAVAGAVAGIGVYAMLALGALAFVLMVTDSRVRRWEAALLVVAYAALIPFLA